MAIPLRLERYFFPIQKVEANPNHDPNKPNDIKTNFNFNIGEVPEQKELFAVELTISSTAESINPPYNFTIVGFALLRVTDTKLSVEELNTVAANLGTNLLVGVARERLNEITSRGPWPSVNIDFVPVHFEPVETQKNKKPNVKDK